MLSSSKARATALAVTILVAACARVAPWKNEPLGNEVNLSFSLRENLVELPSLRIGNRSGRFLLGSAAPQTVIDPDFQTGSRTALMLGEKKTVHVTSASLPLGGVADAIVGADAWQNHAVTIDYRSGLVTWQRDGIFPGCMELFHYPAEPMIEVTVDGRVIAAVVDTSSPDTLLLPARVAGRRTATVSVAGTDFGAIDVRVANVTRARIGNRLLSRFLVTIDYGKRVVGLWRDPRIPLRQTPPATPPPAV